MNKTIKEIMTKLKTRGWKNPEEVEVYFEESLNRVWNEAIKSV